MVAANLARHLREQLADQPADWRPMVYCWRGGLRSGSMVNWMRLVGWDARQLAGGYKSLPPPRAGRSIETVVPQLRLQVICGATGSAKTRVLRSAGRARRAGARPGTLRQPQGLAAGRPARRAAALAEALRDAASRPRSKASTCRARSTSKARARASAALALPVPLVDAHARRAASRSRPTPDARLAYLLRDYAYLGDDRTRAGRASWAGSRKCRAKADGAALAGLGAKPATCRRCSPS